MRLLSDLKRLLPLLLGGVAGLLILVTLVQRNAIGDWLLQIVQMITAVALVAGVLNVIVSNLRTIGRQASGWLQNLVVVVSAVAVFGIELYAGLAGGDVSAPLTAFSAGIFQYAYEPLATAILALLTFFALRAAWHALHARPAEALPIVLVAAIFLIAGGPWAAFVPGLAETLDWIRLYPALGVARGLLLGVGIGALVASVRLLLGFDQPYLDR
jgi:hypothetical protein